MRDRLLFESTLPAVVFTLLEAVDGVALLEAADKLALKEFNILIKPSGEEVNFGVVEVAIILVLLVLLVLFFMFGSGFTKIGYI